MLNVILLVLFVHCHLFAQDQYLISYEKVADYSRKELIDTWKEQKIPRSIAPVKNGIDVYEVIYKTKWHDQSIIKASGLYYVPKNSVKKELPMVTYLHGTQIKRHREVRLEVSKLFVLDLLPISILWYAPTILDLAKAKRSIFITMLKHNRVRLWT